MDRTSWIAIIVCVILLFTYQDILEFFSPTQSAPPGPVTEERQPSPSPAGVPSTAPSSPSTPGSEPVPSTPVRPGPVMASGAEGLRVEEGVGVVRENVLENDYLRVILTEQGGGIAQAELKEHRAEGDDPVTFNRAVEVPMLNVRGLDPEWDVMRYQKASAMAGEVVYNRLLAPDVVLERRFKLMSDYRVKVDQTVYNEGATSEVIPQSRMDLGAITSVYGNRDERRFVGAAWLTHSGNYSEGKLTAFQPSFLGMFPAKSIVRSDEGETVQWAALKTQFFAVILDMEETLASDVVVQERLFPELRDAKGAAIPDGVQASLAVPGFRLEPGASVRQTFTLYLGPKEYERLKSYPHEQDRIMEFGWMRWISGPMLWAMVNIHEFVGNYGLAIIVLTIILRGILWIPQTKANLSAKRMQAVAPLMKEVQDKYKETPEKMNKEMLKIYQDYGVNPVGGCLPLLIQFPIFLGFFYMLQGAVELRHESFLWIGDLSQPDTVFVIPGLEFPINLMPLIMAGTMYVSMSMAPQPSGMDNPMFKIMKFMPVMFLLFCYNYASALSVYWTMQNVLSIVQMRYNLRHHPPTLEELKKQAAERKARRKKRGGGFGTIGR